MMHSGFCGSGISATFLAVGLDTDPLRFRRLNDLHSQFERISFCRETYVSPVASRHCVNAGAKLTGRCGDGYKAAQNPGNGLVVDPTLNAYVPVLENRAYRGHQIYRCREARASLIL
jgi:hypothetical protein